MISGYARPLPLWSLTAAEDARWPSVHGRAYVGRMKKEIVAILLLTLLLLPMWAGIRRIRNLPRPQRDDPPEP